ncbi:hypothetical protein PYW07_002707 [Mythimna separata]|uniref:FP protein C-terminal domain-containing protein n=1 Tax=Mythimna separata TaxID=271217 RepID=A0AAD7YG69_MYTSE|nr:hypothetical protein PYW07_002707 [Mythimna separata]
MPINRTPPPVALPLFTNSTSSESLAPVMMHEATLHQCQSAPDLSKIPTNITERKKRKYEGKADKGPVTLSTFNTSSGDQEFRFEDLMEKIDSIIVQNSELKHSVEVMSSKYDEFLRRVATLEAERIEDKKKIQLLEEKLEQMERKTRSTGIEIRNIPKTDGETKEDLCSLVLNMGTSLNIDVKSSNIKDIYRLKSKDNSHPIIVDFTTVVTKEKVMGGVKKFNKSKAKEAKLNTNHLKINGPLAPVYVAECLTYRAQKLFYIARAFQRSHGYQFCWTANGVVYLRKKVNDPQIRITSEADVEKLKCTE